ncbi:DUF4347 domain-containing protein [Desulfomonile tiedjei]|nr:DUF4347 domain-containing protein [Desulfomonile tiedjei]
MVLEQLEERIVLDGAVANAHDVQDQTSHTDLVDSLGWIYVENDWWFNDDGSGWWFNQNTGWWWNQNDEWWFKNDKGFDYWYHGVHQYWAEENSTGAWFWWDDVNDHTWEAAFSWSYDWDNRMWCWNDWNGSQYFRDSSHYFYQSHDSCQIHVNLNGQWYENPEGLPTNIDLYDGNWHQMDAVESFRYGNHYGHWGYEWGSRINGQLYRDVIYYPDESNDHGYSYIYYVSNGQIIGTYLYVSDDVDYLGNGKFLAISIEGHTATCKLWDVSVRPESASDDRFLLEWTGYNMLSDFDYFDDPLRVLFINTTQESSNYKISYLENNTIVFKYWDSSDFTIGELVSDLRSLSQAFARQIDTVAIDDHGYYNVIKIGDDYVSYGQPQTGSGWTSRLVTEYESAFREWGSLMSSDGQIQFYNCYVAGGSGDIGAWSKQLLSTISQYTNADVFANDDLAKVVFDSNTGALVSVENWDADWRSNTSLTFDSLYLWA